MERVKQNNMDGNKIIERLNRLGDINDIKDVKQLTSSLFPGSHCPLMGAALVLKGIEDALFMVIGTDECTYYTKSLASSDAFGGISGRCLSFVMDTHDVTFGSVAQIEKAFEEVYKEYPAKSIFLISTCVAEIIGDDITSLAKKLSKEYGIPVIGVQTEHFKSVDHIPGIERTITGCIQIMKEQPKDCSVNILGQRLGIFSETELHSILSESGVEIGLMLPSGCTTHDIEIAPKAKLNIVVNETGLGLAKKMKKKFGTPYIMFERYANPERTLNAYRELYEALELEVPTKIHTKYQEILQSVEAAKLMLEGVSYIYGNTPYSNLELNEFMVGLGMEPKLIQLSSIKEKDNASIQSILEKQNPYVAKSANIAPLQYVYDVLKPNLYLGHEYAMRLRKKGIAIVSSDDANSRLGFETTQFIIEQLKDAAGMSKEYQKEMTERGTM